MTGYSDFRIVAECLNYPAVEAPFTTTITIDRGEEAWDHFARRSTPPARAAILHALAPWLVPEMLATQAARERLRRWSEGGGLAASDTPEVRRAIIGRIHILGDDMLQPLVEEALLRMPPPVLDHLQHHTVILPVGLSAAGVCSLDAWPEPDAVEVRRPIPMRYGRPPGVWAHLFRRRPREEDQAAEFMALVGHECAHAWLVSAPTPSERLPRAEATEHYERLIKCAVEWNLLDKVIKPRERDEHQAEALALAWGFSKATRGDACAWNARRMVLAEAAAIAVRQ